MIKDFIETERQLIKLRSDLSSRDRTISDLQVQLVNLNNTITTLQDSINTVSDATKTSGDQLDAHFIAGAVVHFLLHTFNKLVTFLVSIKLSSLTASQPVRTDASKVLTNGKITLSDTTNDVTGIVSVPNGGTGLSSLTLKGVLIGESTSPVNVTAAGITGQVLTATTFADPSFQNPAVSSVFGRTGAVAAANGDYSFSNISGTVANSQLPNVGPGAGTHSPVTSITIDAQGRITAIS